MATPGKLIQEIRSERSIPDGREVDLTYRTEGHAPVPALLLLPKEAGAVPGVVLVHGYSCHRLPGEAADAAAAWLEGVLEAE